MTLRTNGITQILSPFSVAYDVAAEYIRLVFK